MRQEVAAFREEIAELDRLLETLDPADWARPTPFKSWTVWEVMAHLHWSDAKAVLAIRDPEAFARDAAGLAASFKRGVSLSALTAEALGPLSPRELRGRWRDTGDELCTRVEALESKARVVWYGPDMGARTFCSARQMETWAHGQDLYDLLGRERRYHDRLQNIAVLGVRTFGWTFANRRLPVPPEVPRVRLRAPSGSSWEWNATNENDHVEGSASDFCHVVTQGRNIADTRLEVVGDIATQWMAMAQCFAGSPSDPPPPGARTGRRA